MQQHQAFLQGLSNQKRCPLQLTAQFVLHGCSLPMHFLGRFEKHFLITSTQEIVCSHNLMLNWSCIATETQRIGQIGNHGKDSFGLLK